MIFTSVVESFRIQVGLDTIRMRVIAETALDIAVGVDGRHAEVVVINGRFPAAAAAV